MNIRGQNGASPLHLACANNHSGIVEMLLQKGNGLDVNLADSKNVTALYLSAYHGYPRIVRLLLWDKRTDVNVRNARGHGAIHAAAYKVSSQKGNFNRYSYAWKIYYFCIGTRGDHGSTPVPSLG